MGSYRKEERNQGVRIAPTNVAPSAILEGEDYGLKASTNGRIQQRGGSVADSCPSAPCAEKRKKLLVLVAAASG
jgi:hypothetical protein